MQHTVFKQYCQLGLLVAVFQVAIVCCVCCSSMQPCTAYEHGIMQSKRFQYLSANAALPVYNTRKVAVTAYCRPVRRIYTAHAVFAVKAILL
jgi:hypothetical protein